MPIYNNNQEILVSCNETDIEYWQERFEGISNCCYCWLRLATITNLLTSIYSNTKQRVLFRDLNSDIWSVSPRLFEYLKSKSLFCNQIEFQMTITMQRSGSSDSVLTMNKQLSYDECERLSSLLKYQNETLILPNLYPLSWVFTSIPRVIRLGSTSVISIDTETESYRDLAVVAKSCFDHRFN